MSNPALEFENELEVFRRDAESAVQFFYVWRTINEVASENSQIVNTLNKTPRFWNTISAALLTSTFIALGRVFDQKSPHNVNKLLQIAQKNKDLFSLSALSERKKSLSPNYHEWLDEYLLGIYIPCDDDFRRLRKHVDKRRKIYKVSLQPIRHKVYAHTELSEQVEINALFANAKIKEIQQLLVFLCLLHNCLWELFFNGRKPTLRSARYSVSQMRKKPRLHGSLQEKLTHETETFLKLISKNQT